MHYGILIPIIHDAARLARQSRKRMTVETKADGSVVTSVDRDVETMLRERLAPIMPGAAFWGEEFGFDELNDKGVWLIDPIDGTTNFAHGSPLWGISVGFAINGVLRIGGVALPDLEEFYFGGKGLGVMLNDSMMRPIPPGIVESTQPIGFCEAIGKLQLGLAGKQRCSGAFVVDGAFVLQQRLRAFVGIRQHLYDIAPIVLFAQELGLEVGYLDGSPFEVQALLVPETIGKPWGIYPKGGLAAARG